MPRKMTRGSGLLEAFLARKRHAIAERLIPRPDPNDCLVDLGCGNYPAFLVSSRFRERIGLDRDIDPQLAREMSDHGIRLVEHDLDAKAPLPLETESCDVVTMLAVLEHIEPTRGTNLTREVHRILRPGGVFVLTTPAPWTDKLPRIMSRLGLVSKVEIEDHKDTYGLNKICSLLADSGFPSENCEGGYFELGMNCWAKAIKAGGEGKHH